MAITQGKKIQITGDASTLREGVPVKNLPPFGKNLEFFYATPKYDLTNGILVDPIGDGSTDPKFTNDLSRGAKPTLLSTPLLDNNPALNFARTGTGNYLKTQLNIANSNKFSLVFIHINKSATAITQSRTLIDAYNPTTNRRLRLRTSNSNSKYDIVLNDGLVNPTSGAITKPTTTNATLSTRTVVGLTYDKSTSTFKWYLDGVLDNTYTDLTSFFDFQGQFILGINSVDVTTGNDYDGALGAMYGYSRVLSDAEMATFNTILVSAW